MSTNVNKNNYIYTCGHHTCLLIALNPPGY